MTKEQLAWDNEYVAAVRGSDQLSRRLFGEDERFSDFDLLPRPSKGGPKPTQFKDFSKAHDKFLGLAETLPDNHPAAPLLGRRLEGHLMYIGALLGEGFEYGAYARTLMGITPVAVGEDEIDALAEDVKEKAQEAGFNFENSRRAKDNYRQSLLTPREAKAEAIREAEWAEGLIGEFLELPSGRVKPEVVIKDVFWSGYLGTTPRGKTVSLINAHKRHPNTAGRLGVTVPHESAGHGVQLGSWIGRLASGEMSPALGITTTHTAEVPHMETVATFAEQLAWVQRIARGLSTPQHEFEFAHYMLRDAVYNNVHMQVNSGTSLVEAATYARDRLHFDTWENIQGKAKVFREHPVARAYMTVYWPVKKMSAPFVDIVAKGDKKQMWKLHELYNGQYTAEQVRQLAAARSRSDWQDQV